MDTHGSPVTALSTQPAARALFGRLGGDPAVLCPPR
jgi:hypothetical protein